jgi:hypothetical protein
MTEVTPYRCSPHISQQALNSLYSVQLLSGFIPEAYRAGCFSNKHV